MHLACPFKQSLSDSHLAGLAETIDNENIDCIYVLTVSGLSELGTEVTESMLYSSATLVQTKYAESRRSQRHANKLSFGN